MPRFMALAPFPLLTLVVLLAAYLTSASEAHLILEADTGKAVPDKLLEQLCRKILAAQKGNVVIVFATDDSPFEHKSYDITGITG